MISKILKLIFRTPIYSSPANNNLDGKIIVVTGISGSIGSAIAKVLLTHKAHVVGIDAVLKPIKVPSNDESRLSMLQGDVISEVSIRSTIEAIVAKYGKIDVLINNAGVFSEKLIENLSVQEFEKVVNVNVKGPFLLSKYVLPCMKKQQSGLIINIGSKISHNTQVDPGKVIYATSKYALEGFSFALNREVRPFGVRVACLMPGTVNTFLSRKSHTFLSPFEMGEIITFMIQHDQVDFERMVIKSIHQNI